MAVVEKDIQPSGERRGRYPKEFRRESAALVIDQNRTVADVARSLGVNEQTLGNWFAKNAWTAASEKGSPVLNVKN